MYIMIHVDLPQPTGGRQFLCQVGPAILQELCLGIRTVFILVSINDIVYIFTAIAAV